MWARLAVARGDLGAVGERIRVLLPEAGPTGAQLEPRTHDALKVPVRNRMRERGADLLELGHELRRHRDSEPAKLRSERLD